MAFLRRDHPERSPTTRVEDQDAPAALRARLGALISYIHSQSGRLPVESVVAALAVTDELAEVIQGAEQDRLDVHGLVTLCGILDDYLPTTLRTYLALEPDVVEVELPSGVTPRAALVEQVDALWIASSQLRVATQARDADALLSQGSFLRAKFTGSDLDL